MPLYQDVDGVSRFGDLERLMTIARTLYTPAAEPDERMFELLLFFHGLEKWLDKVGNISRTVLAVGDITEGELRRVAASIRNLEQPSNAAEGAVAGARLIDRAGVRGLAQRFATARREGQSMLDVVREEVANAWVPEWMPESGRAWLERRFEARRRVCREILDEMALVDAP